MRTFKTLKYAAFGTLILILVVLATATVIEKVFGTEVVSDVGRSCIYHYDCLLVTPDYHDIEYYWSVF